MMSELNLSFRPELRRPVLVAAFRGWNDGGQGASLGAGYLAKQWGASRFAEIDPESFYDFQATRPHVSLEDGMTRRLDWPENGFFHSEIPGTDRDAATGLARGTGAKLNYVEREWAVAQHPEAEGGAREDGQEEERPGARHCEPPFTSTGRCPADAPAKRCRWRS